MAGLVAGIMQNINKNILTNINIFSITKTSKLNFGYFSSKMAVFRYFLSYSHKRVSQLCA